MQPQRPISCIVFSFVDFVCLNVSRSLFLSLQTPKFSFTLEFNKRKILMTKKTLILLPLFLLALSLSPALLPTAAADAKACCCGDNCKCPADACKCADQCKCPAGACECPAGTCKVADACKCADQCKCPADACKSAENCTAAKSCKCPADVCSSACQDKCTASSKGDCSEKCASSTGAKSCCPAGSACPVKDAA